MSSQPEPQIEALWPERLIALARDWRDSGYEARQRSLGEMWLIVNGAISARIWRDAGGNGGLEPDDVYDIAAEKALDLLQKFDRGDWDPGGATPGRVNSFIGTIARNAFIDFMRTTGRKRHQSVEINVSTDTFQRRHLRVVAGTDSADAEADRKQLVEAIRVCASQLKPRARKMWLMRVLLGMSSRDIAGHPEIEMKPAAVDVALGRARSQMKQCIERKGFEPNELPPGTVAALWEAFRYETGEW